MTDRKETTLQRFTLIRSVFLSLHFLSFPLHSVHSLLFALLKNFSNLFLINQIYIPTELVCTVVSINALSSSDGLTFGQVRFNGVHCSLEFLQLLLNMLRTVQTNYSQNVNWPWNKKKKTGGIRSVYEKWYRLRETNEFLFANCFRLQCTFVHAFEWKRLNIIANLNKWFAKMKIHTKFSRETYSNEGKSMHWKTTA